MGKYIKEMRIKHYLKNILIFLPIVFSGNFFDVNNLLKCIWGFLSFSMLASVIYIVNDIKDVEKDKKHIEKCKRPIASGKLKIKNAIIFLIVLLIISFVFNYMACGINNVYSYIFLLAYLILNVLYSFGLKNEPIIDIVILVSGFLIRVMYGASIIGVEISNWLYLTVISGAFYMGLGKRRNEIKKQGDKSREVLKRYNQNFLDKNMYVFVALCIVFYSLWCVDSNTIIKIGSNILIWTVPVLMIIFMKYSLDIEGDSYGDPIDVIFNDKSLIAIIIMFVILIFGIVYLL